MNVQKNLETLLQKVERLEEKLAFSSNTTTVKDGYLEFTDKEIMKMPKDFRTILKISGYRVHARKRCTGRYNCSYEIRFYRDGYALSISAPTREAAKQRFIEKIKAIVPFNKNPISRVPTRFHEFAIYWFDNFHKRKVAEGTYKKNLQTYHRNIESTFKNDKLSEIMPVKVQHFLDTFSDKGRTKETLYSLLNQIFDCSLKHGLIKLNPINMCFYQKHEREHGVAISKTDEIKLLNHYKGTPYELEFALILYTGLRPCEYKTAVLSEKFIKSQNCKRKGGKIEFKYIPVSPMLKPYVDNINQIQLHSQKTISKRLKCVLPNHTLKDMRTTFQTRLDECGVPDKVIGIVMGNTIGKGDRIKETYTDTQSKEYLEYLYNWMQQFKY